MATSLSQPSILCGWQGEPHAPRWSKAEYYRMAELGFFEGRRVELIEGEVLEMAPIGSEHATAVTLAQSEVEDAFGTGFFARSQAPLSIAEFSEPEPDVVVVKGKIRDYAASHPTTAELVIEISHSTLNYDRTTKATLYARAGIAEYWILNLEARQLEVHRAPLGEKYSRILLLSESESITPLAAPNAEIKIVDLLP